MDIINLAGEIRTFLKSFDPEDPVQALAYLESLSAFKEEKEEKRLKAASYKVLDAAAPEGMFEFNGIVIEKVNQTKTVFKRTGEVIQAEANLKVAQDTLKAAQQAAGFDTLPGNQYWVVKKVEPAEESL